MTQKFGWKLAVWVLLCACVSSGTAQARGRTRGQRQAEQAAYSNGQVFVYLTPEGKLKRVASKSTKLAKKTKQEALELHQVKQQAYTQARGTFVEKNPNQKYAPLKPFKPEFITLKADLVQHTGRAPTVEPKKHYYGLYKVGVDGKVMYEPGYAFSDAAQQIKYRARYVLKYNRWVKKSKATTEPIAPVFEKLCERMTEANAQKAATAMATWKKRHDLWVKRGSKPESEPEKPDLSIYQEKIPPPKIWKKRHRQPHKDKAKDDPKEKKDTPKSETDPKEKKDTPKTKNDAGWS